jgi:hypothetical protein
LFEEVELANGRAVGGFGEVQAHALRRDRFEPGDELVAKRLTPITRFPLPVLHVLDGELADAFPLREDLLDRRAAEPGRPAMAQGEAQDSRRRTGSLRDCSFRVLSLGAAGVAAEN